MRNTFIYVASLAAAAMAKSPQTILPWVLAPRSGPEATHHHHHHHKSMGEVAKSSGSARLRRSGPARLGRRQDATALLGQFQSLMGQMQSNQQSIHATREDVANDPKAASNSQKYSDPLSNKIAAMRAADGGATPVIGQLNQILAPFGANEGKTYYDQNNSFEVLLKDFVDSNKYMLTDITYIVSQIPVLGPVLFDVVYDTKCVIEDLLNGLENTTDGLLNGDGLAGLQSLLSGFNVLGQLGLNL